MTDTPSAKALRDWATDNGLPVPANVLIVPLHGDAAGYYEVSTFDFQTQYRYAERVQYIRDLCAKAQGQIVETTDKKVIARISI